jgi:thioredoxin reductase
LITGTAYYSTGYIKKTTKKHMEKITDFEVIIIGGSYAGLSAAMSLGRSMRNVLVIDSGKPCNAQTPHSHNFLTHDGKSPAAIAREAREQVAHYPTIHFLNGTVVSASGSNLAFTVMVDSGEQFKARKLLFATGVKDIMPPIKGFAECWGISVLHCPYCHGYEVRQQPTGILANGDMGFEFASLIQHWTKDLTLFTNGAATLTEEQTGKLNEHNIRIHEGEIEALQHKDGHLQSILFKDGTHHELHVLYARCVMEQHCSVPQSLGCALTETGFLQVDEFRKTSVPGIYAAGDCTTMFRTVASAVGTGNMAGAVLNKELIAEEF